MVDRIFRLDATLPFSDTKGQAVELTLAEKTAGGTTLLSGTIAQQLSFADLAGSLDLDLSAVPVELLPTIDSVMIVLERSNKLFAAFDTEHLGVAAVTDRTSKDYLASVQTDLSVKLSDLPVVDSIVSASDDAGIGAFAVLAASRLFGKSELDGFNTLLLSVPAAGKNPPFPSRDVTAGQMLSATLTLGADTVPLVLSFATASGSKNA